MAIVKVRERNKEESRLDRLKGVNMASMIKQFGKLKKAT